MVENEDLHLGLCLLLLGPVIQWRDHLLNARQQFPACLLESIAVRLAKIVFGSGFLAVRWAESEIFGIPGAAVGQSDFG